MTISRTSKFHVAIVGAGLGGLLLALSLQKHCPEIAISIYESAYELTEVGAGIGAWPRIWEILRYLGLEEDLLKTVGTQDNTPLSMVFRKGDEEDLVTVCELTPKIHTFHRAELQKLLVNHLHSADKIIHFAKRLESYIEPDPAAGKIVLQFTDGTSATCDVLVGSDGIRSAVRRKMYTELADEADRKLSDELRSMIEPVWSGTVAYRCLVPADKLPKAVLQEIETANITLGPWKHLVCYPVSRGTLINIVAMVSTPGGEGTKYEGPWTRTATTEEVEKEYATWAPKFKTLLSFLDKPTAWAINTVRPLPTYVEGNVALIGDAAHAMTPHQGSGAGQAIEDGFILSTILAHPSVNLSNLPAALRVYDSIRRPFSQQVLQRSRDTGRLHQLLRQGWENLTPEQSRAGEYPRDMLTRLGETYETESMWVAETSSIMEDQKKAMRMVEELSFA